MTPLHTKAIALMPRSIPHFTDEKLREEWLPMLTHARRATGQEQWKLLNVNCN